MRLIFFSVPEADGLEEQLAEFRYLGWSVTHITSREMCGISTQFDVGISDRCNFLIPEANKAFCTHGIFNFHPSLLPLHPGSFSQFWSLIFNDQFGVTCHEITQELDRGRICDVVPVPYSSDENFISVYNRTRVVTKGMIWRLLHKVALGARIDLEHISHTSQPNHTSSFTRPLIQRLPNGWATSIREARSILSGHSDRSGRVILG